MMFWVIATLLTVIALLCVIIPLLRGKGTRESEIEYDKAVYHSRIGEIEKDQQFGRISDEMARSAIAEEGRKLIGYAKSQSATGNLSKRSNWILVVLSSLLIPAASFGAYLSIGSPDLPDQTLASRLNTPPEHQSVIELVARAEAHLAENPDDAGGWATLAPVYSRLNRHDEAVRAWAKVYLLRPDTPEIRATLAESMIAASEGVITAEARKLFSEELKVNQSSAKARFYLATALGQEGKHAEAIEAWDELISGGNDKSPWMEAALEFRSRSASALGDTSTPQVPQAASGPTPEDMEAASQMTTDERKEMILGMVSGLAEKLKENPADKQGWLRLIRAYMVLDKVNEAKEAISTASNVNSDDAAFLASLEEIKTMLDSMRTDQQESVLQ